MTRRSVAFDHASQHWVLLFPSSSMKSRSQNKRPLHQRITMTWPIWLSQQGALAAWMPGCPAAWTPGCLCSWLAYCVADWLAYWLAGWLADWLAYGLAS